jgi:hypothetical protein
MKATELIRLLEWQLPKYGGIPSNGGYDSFTEYEVGAARMAEAAHCILGSISKASRGGFGIEKDHVEEEMGIILDSQKEYSKQLYVDRLDPNNSYVKKSFKSMAKASHDLKRASFAYQKKIDSTMPNELQDLAFVCYELLNVLAKSIEKSLIRNDNAFGYTIVKQVVQNLKTKVDLCVKLEN